MTITTLPTRGPTDLGAALSNTRAPTANELSAIHVEKLKDRMIEAMTDIGLTSGATSGSLWSKILFGFVTTVATYATTAISIVSTDGLYGPLNITPAGITGPTDMIYQPSMPASGAGKGVTVAGGVGAVNQDGGTGNVDAGPGNGSGSGGNLRLGRDNAAAIFSGLDSGGSTWTHEGKLTTTGHTVSAAGDVAIKSYVDQVPARSVSGTTDTAVAGDIGGVVIYSQAGGVEVELPDLSGSLTAGKAMVLTLQGTNAATIITVDPGASVTIDGSSSNFVASTGKARVSLISVDGLAWYSGTP